MMDIFKITQTRKATVQVSGNGETSKMLYLICILVIFTHILNILISCKLSDVLDLNSSQEIFAYNIVRS